MQEIFSQSSKFSEALSMYSSNFEVTEANELHFDTLNVPRMQEMDLQNFKSRRWLGEGLGSGGSFVS